MVLTTEELYMEGNLDYFITKLSSVPEESWGMSSSDTDVWSHLTHDEVTELFTLVKSYVILLNANDDEYNERYQGATPKERVLNVLRHVKQVKPPYVY